MSVTRSFTLNVSHSRVAVFDRSLERPFNFWTARHLAQGFAWRPGSVGFGTLEESGPHHVSVMVRPAELDVSPGAVRAIQVPFKVPFGGDIEIASIVDSVPFQLPAQLYALRFECLVGEAVPEIKLIFMMVDGPTFKIIRSDALLYRDGELLVSTSSS